jgi:hypothetical protein
MIKLSNKKNIRYLYDNKLKKNILNMSKPKLSDFADWLGLSPESIRLASQIVEVSDPDGAYTHLQDMGEQEAAEAVEAIWFEYGSIKKAIQAFKEDTGLYESKKTKKITLEDLKKLVKTMVNEEMRKK